MGAESPPKVFLSYSHDSEEHRDRVLALADRLRAEGIDARVDQYVDNPSEGWPQWMARQIGECDFAVLVCTPTYRQRFEREDESDAGKGAKLEGLILLQLLYEAHTKNDKIVAVFFEEGKETDIPLVLRPYTYYRLMAQYEGLYRRLTGQHDTPAPAIGTIRTLPPRARPWLVASASEAVVEGEREEAVMVVVTEEMLVDELAKVFFDPDDARKLAVRAGFLAARIPVFRMPDTFWHAMVEAASNGAIAGKVQAIADAAAKVHPANDVFKRYRSP